jgi:hypothetical protein
VACPINILWSSYDDRHEWCLYYKCLIALALNFNFAGVINYPFEVMLQIVASLMINIYIRNMFIVQATAVGHLSLLEEKFC